MRLKIVGAVLAVLMALGLAGMVYRENAIADIQRRHVLALQSEARPYEVELESIKSELRDAETHYFEVRRTARLALGVRAVDVKDIEWIESTMQNESVSPVLVLDCEAENFAELLEAAKGKDWEVMLTSTPVRADTNELIAEIKQQVEESGMRHTNVFLLRREDDSERSHQLLVEDGFRGLARYQTTTGSGITEEGLPWFSYIFYRSQQVNLRSWLSNLMGNSGAMIITIDMEAIHARELSEEAVASFLNVVNRYAEDGNLEFATVADIVDEIDLAANASMETRVEMYNAYVAERQARIAELEGIISGIYARWNEAETDEWLSISLARTRSRIEQFWSRGAQSVRSTVTERIVPKIDRVWNKTSEWIGSVF